jgi:hypothetical protein
MTTLQTLSSAVKVATDAATTATGQANIATIARKATEKAATQVAVDAGAVASAATIAVAINNRIYPGLYNADPVARPDGSPIQDGDVCSLVSGVMRVRIAGAWQDWTTASGAAAEAAADAAALSESFAEDWATKTAGDVDGAGAYSAKEYAQGAQAATGGSAKNWAQQTGADVTGAGAGSRSAKSWSQDDLTPGAGNLGGSAKDWAQSGGLPDGVNKSAKGFAADAKASRDGIDNRIYPGTYAVDPVTRPDGSAMVDGDVCFTTGNVPKVYGGGVWAIVAAPSSADLANSADPTKGAALIGYDGAAVQAVLDAAKPMASYAALRAYTGRASGVRITAIGLSGFFVRDATDVTTADDSGTVIVDGSGRRWKRIYAGSALDVRWFGAVANSAADQTAAIQAAENAAVAIGAASSRYPVISFPAGDFRCNYLTWNKVASWVGAEVGNTRLLYNGVDNTAGSYIVGLAAGAGAVPYAGFYNMTFSGFDSTSTANPCAAHCILNLGTNLDWGFKLENLSFANCFDDALQLRGAASVFVNLYANRLRWDAVGGFGIYLGSNNTNSGSPFVLDQFTLDNNLSANMITKMTAQGRYDGSRWGKGVLRVEDGQGAGIRASNARIELNRKLILHNGQTALFYSNQTIASTRCLIEVTNIHGTGRQDQQTFMCRDVTGRTDFRWSQVSMSAVLMFRCDTTPERDIYRNQVGNGVSLSITTQQLGLSIYGHAVEFRNQPPEQLPSVFASYRFGDIVYSTTSGAGKPVAWQCRFPAAGAGFALANSNNITTTAVVTAASNVVSVSSALLSNFAVGLNITLVGAGVAGADLDTRVTAYDEVNNTITVNDVPTTGVNPATIKAKGAQFTPMLYQQGVSADKGNAAFTLTLGSSEPTAYVNSPLTANRAVTLQVSAANLGTIALAHGRFRIVRTAASTGAFTLDVPHAAGTKSLATGQWCEVEYQGSSGTWILTAFGSL